MRSSHRIFVRLCWISGWNVKKKKISLPCFFDILTSGSGLTRPYENTQTSPKGPEGLWDREEWYTRISGEMVIASGRRVPSNAKLQPYDGYTEKPFTQWEKLTDVYMRNPFHYCSSRVHTPIHMDTLGQTRVHAAAWVRFTSCAR